MLKYLKLRHRTGVNDTSNYFNNSVTIVVGGLKSKILEAIATSAISIAVNEKSVRSQIFKELGVNTQKSLSGQCSIHATFVEYLNGKEIIKGLRVSENTHKITKYRNTDLRENLKTVRVFSQSTKNFENSKKSKNGEIPSKIGNGFFSFLRKNLTDDKEFAIIFNKELSQYGFCLDSDNNIVIDGKIIEDLKLKTTYQHILFYLCLILSKESPPILLFDDVSIKIKNNKILSIFLRRLNYLATIEKKQVVCTIFDPFAVKQYLTKKQFNVVLGMCRISNPQKERAL